MLRWPDASGGQPRRSPMPRHRAAGHPVDLAQRRGPLVGLPEVDRARRRPAWPARRSRAGGRRWPARARAGRRGRPAGATRAARGRAARRRRRPRRRASGPRRAGHERLGGLAAGPWRSSRSASGSEPVWRVHRRAASRGRPSSSHVTRCPGSSADPNRCTTGTATRHACGVRDQDGLAGVGGGRADRRGRRPRVARARAGPSRRLAGTRRTRRAGCSAARPSRRRAAARPARAAAARSAARRRTARRRPATERSVLSSASHRASRTERGSSRVRSTGPR